MSREDARSDLLLSGAVFVFGPFALRLLLIDILGIPVTRAGLPVLVIVVALLCTMLVPLLLMKYRNERPAVVLGLGPGDHTVPTGLLAGVPLLVAGGVELVAGSNPIAQHPVVALAAGAPLVVVMRLVAWVGVVALALYATVKARDAFGGVPVRLDAAAWRIGRILALAAAVTTVLGVAQALIDDAVEPMAAVTVVVWPLAVAGAIWLILQRTPGVGTTAMPMLITPTVLCAIGTLLIPRTFSNVAPMLHAVVLSAGVGLAVGLLAERSRRGGGVLVLAVLIALGTGLALPVRV